MLANCQPENSERYTTQLNKRIFFEGCTFFVDENVYEPAEDSFLMAENINAMRCDRVLDVGTGCGIQGIIAAQTANKVISVDVNPRAIHCAINNALLNKVVSKMDFLLGDLLNSFNNETKFDIILFNAPYLPLDNLEDASLLALAWDGGKSGRMVIDRFIGQVSNNLSDRGRILLVQSNLAGINETVSAFSSHGFDGSVVDECNVPFFEKIVLIEATRS